MRARLAVALFGAWVAVVVLYGALAVAGLTSLGDLPVVLAMAGLAAVGMIVSRAQPGNPVGWILSAIAILFPLALTVEGYVEYSPDAASLPAAQVAAWINSWSFAALLILVAVFVPLLFPDGRLLSRRWGVVAWLGAGAIALAVVGIGLRPGPLESVPIENPLGVPALADALELARSAALLLAILATLASAASIFVRLGRARGSERQQLKWFAYAGSVMLGAFVVAGITVAFEAKGGVYYVGLAGFLTGLFALTVLVPIAIGFAILRHRLYDIDVVINRTLVYGALTISLAGAYLANVLLLGVVFRPLTGGSDLAIAGSTLAVAALFRPLRSRFQAAVDRRFYRRRYDAERTLERFSTRLRDQVDLDALSGELQAVVRDTMQPAHVSLWLRARRADEALR